MAGFTGCTEKTEKLSNTDIVSPSSETDNVTIDAETTPREVKTEYEIILDTTDVVKSSRVYSYLYSKGNWFSQRCDE